MFPTPVDIAAIAYIALTIIGMLIAYSLLKRLFRKIGEIWSRESLFGGDHKTRLISLGLVALFFSKLFFSLANAIIFFIGNIFVDVPRSLFTNWQANQSFCTSTSDEGIRLCAGQMGFGFVQAWTSGISDSLNRFGPTYISYSQLILMLALWAAVALFLSAAPSKDKNEGAEHKLRLQFALDRLSPTTKQNIVFFFVLVVAGYLSIAAIAAIPGLEEAAVPSEAIGVERLEQQLTEALTQSQSRIPQELQLSDPFEKTEASNVDYLKSRYQQLLNLYPKLLEDIKAQAVNSESSAISAYRASVIDRKGTQETAQHFLNIDAWFRRDLSRMEAQVNECRRRIIAADSFFRTSLLEESQHVDDMYFDSSTDQYLNDAVVDAREVCQLTATSEPVPERPDLGSNMGPFSYIASWLLRTESLPLAQIVGLLGFGLLGSAVSSLVRSTNKLKDQPLVEELATVIIRGATAAVVVFLAVKGGLAVFTSGESDPNSYVLLLTCLVAAVFSEDVWQEAHKRLSKGLGEGNGKPPITPVIPAETNKTEITPASGEDEHG